MRAQTVERRKFAFMFTGMRLGFAVLALHLGVTAAFGAEGNSPNDGNTVLIHTDAGDVTMADARANLAALPPQTQITLLRDPAALSNMVRLIAAQELLLKEATDKGWDKKPDVAVAVTAAVERIRADIILRSYISTDTQPPKDYPSDAELQSAYVANKAVFWVPRKFHYAQILIALPKGADKATEDRATAKLADVQQKLKASGADFGAIATASSDDSVTAMRQGEVGALAETQILPDLKETLVALQVGAVSQPIRSDSGWHILKLLDVADAHMWPREEVRAKFREARAQEIAKARIDAVMQKTTAPSEDALTHLTGQPAP